MYARRRPVAGGLHRPAVPHRRRPRGGRLQDGATDDAAELDRRVEGYRLQGASYALTIAATTAEPVSRVTFLFLTPNGPVERHLDDLDAAVERVRALVTAGQEITVNETELTA